MCPRFPLPVLVRHGVSNHAPRPYGGRRVRCRLVRAALPAALAVLLPGCAVFCAGAWNYGPYDFDGLVQEGLARWGTIPLFEKEQRLRAVLEARHLSPEGLLLYRTPHRPGWPGAPWYADYADQAAWQGALVAAAAWRVAAAPSDEARALLDRALDGLHLLIAGQGVPGVLARNAAPRGADGRPPPFADARRHRPGAPPYEGYVFRIDPGKAQFAGALYGLAVAWNVLAEGDPARARVAADVAALVGRLMDHDWRATEADGTPCTYGDLRVRQWGFRVGAHLMAQLGFTAAAARMTGRARFVLAHRTLAAGDLDDLGDFLTFEWLGTRNRSNDVLAVFLAEPLMRYGREEARAAAGAALDEWFQDRVAEERNPFFTYTWARHVPAGAGRAARLAQARLTLRLFPWDLRIYEQDHRARRDFPLSPWLNVKTGGRVQALWPLLVHERAMDSFLWKSDPYALYDSPGADGAWEVAGVDFLVAYWMGRAAGLLGADE